MSPKINAARVRSTARCLLKKIRDSWAYMLVSCLMILVKRAIAIGEASGVPAAVSI